MAAMADLAGSTPFGITEEFITETSVISKPSPCALRLSAFPTWSRRPCGRRLRPRPPPEDFHPVRFHGIKASRLHPLDEERLAAREGLAAGCLRLLGLIIIKEAILGLKRVRLVAVSPIEHAGIRVQSREHADVRV